MSSSTVTFVKQLNTDTNSFAESSSNAFSLSSFAKTRQCVFVHWFQHLSRKSWCDEDDIDHALQAFLLLFNENGKRTNIMPPTLMGETEIEEYAVNCANHAYKLARFRAMEGLVFDAP